MLRFGTDGVRGDADRDLTNGFVESLGRAVARVLGRQEYVIGRDTRASSVRIEQALIAGLAAEGAAPRALGVLPTPAIAYLAQQHRVPCAVVSASHNPWTDNGVKVIGADGWKLADDLEVAIERELEAVAKASTHAVDRSNDSGAVALSFAADESSAASYVAHVLDALEGRSLADLHVVVDCANGAAFDVAPRVLRAAGAEVTVLHAEPDGGNINADSGSTHPEALQSMVREQRANVGLALDGDADRVVAVDERGEIVDGDHLMAMTAIDLHARGQLRNDAIAVTVMSNLGLRRALAAARIEVIETPVGDRHVVAAMRERNLSLGGEQSGHIVFADHATTGDGLLTGVLVADLIGRSRRPLSELATCMTRLPQVLVNVRLAGRIDLHDATAVQDAVQRAETRLGDQGRVVVRTSGTEPLVRIMVEAPTEADAAEVAGQIRDAVIAAAGQTPNQ
jgi:phosphoglucosamine mutase